jgi:uncharacterized protein YwgA
LQKVVYLLDQLGMQSGAAFEYHHYGPYSEAVSEAVADAKFWDQIEEVVKFRRTDGAPYSVFKTKGPVPAVLGDLSVEAARRALEKFQGCTSTVLELAATVHWLAFRENHSDWRTEMEIRKEGKTDNGRLDKALALLRDIGLAPEESSRGPEL